MSESQENPPGPAAGKPSAGAEEPAGPPARPAGTQPHRWYRIWAEAAGAWAIGLAWPVYSNIASGPDALTSYGLRRPDLLVLIALISLAGPLVITICELVIRRLFGERARRIVHGAVIGVLLSLIVWRWLFDHDWPELLRNLLPPALAALVAWLYLKTELVRNFALMLSFATIVVIAAFATKYPITDELWLHEPGVAVKETDADTPVVIVVFDELPLAALERPDGTIDPRFPAFAELARKATWYPDAVSVADQTIFALPSILTGTDPDSSGDSTPPAPGLANFPDSICRIARDGGYKIHSYEPVTDLCEQNWNLGTRVTATIRRALGGDNPLPSPLLPAQLDGKVARAINAPFDVPWKEYDTGRREAFEDFIAGLPTDRRSLSVLHSTLPHILWMYSPDGSEYRDIRAADDTLLTNPSGQGEVDRNAQQMMLQLQFTDRELGRLIARMKARGTWNESLFVVTADHGTAFQKGGSRRMVNLFNEGWIAPVPLFIKYPGQERGRLVRGTVDGRDIAPTVAATLGLDPGGGVTGRDLTGLGRLPQKQRTEMVATIGGSAELDLKAVRREQRQASRYLNQLLGRSFYAPGGHAGLLGEKPTGMTELPARPLDPAPFENVDLSSGHIQAYYQAPIEPPGGVNPGPLAISLNGRIEATATPWRDAEGWQVGAVLPTGAFRDGKNDIRVFAIG